jgi:poly(3-hydroxybutyrate) depolymerase
MVKNYALLWTALALSIMGTTQGSDISAAFIAAADKQYGEEGRKAAEFLMTSAPTADKATLSETFLTDNLALALEARARFPWAKAVPEDIFLNSVLPYASLDEKRDPWRRQLLAAAAPLVKDCHTATEAVQALNRDLFQKLNVHYSTDRESANQSPAQSIASGKASCTGLSLLLVDACRSVGIPARIAGLSQWTDKPGNHTWVEIWDGGWHFTGAAEYSPEGLDHTWFSDEIAHARKVQAIYAASWKQTGSYFPLAWDTANISIPAIVVTNQYKQPAGNIARALLHVQLFDKPSGRRLEAPVEWISASGMILASATTKTNSADLNNMAELSASPGSGGFLRMRQGAEWREWPVQPSGDDDRIVKLYWQEGALSDRAVSIMTKWLAQPAAKRGPMPDLSLSAKEAAKILELLWTECKATVARDEQDEMAAKEIRWGDKKMPWLERTFGTAPSTGRSLWISLHGGGGAPPELNDEQWHNQIRLYEPPEGIVVAPRAPTNTWDLWHQSHIDPMLDRLIAGMVSTRGVDPNKVYVLGYSAGGDGVYQLGPRMADRWAAASMMAGHPNDARPESLRNLPFFIFVGGDDNAYNRNEVAVEWGAQLDALAAADPGGYPHKTTIYPGLPHWMNRRDAEVLPWMAARTRNPWPKKVVWLQNEVTHDRFYWLEMPPGIAQKGQLIHAGVQGQIITLESANVHNVVLRLSDSLVNLDQPVTVVADGKTVFSGLVSRSAAMLSQSLEDRADPSSAACAQLKIAW